MYPGLAWHILLVKQLVNMSYVCRPGQPPTSTATSACSAADAPALPALCANDVGSKAPDVSMPNDNPTQLLTTTADLQEVIASIACLALQSLHRDQSSDCSVKACGKATAIYCPCHIIVCWLRSLLYASAVRPLILHSFCIGR